jgi:hypothetical protein
MIKNKRKMPFDIAKKYTIKKFIECTKYKKELIIKEGNNLKNVQKNLKETNDKK